MILSVDHGNLMVLIIQTKNKQEEGHKNTTEPVNKVRGKVLFN